MTKIKFCISREQCAPPLVVASGIDEKTLKKEGVCAASLPTTMAIVAGFLIQNALKYTLGFGEVSHYLGYNAMLDHFPNMKLKPNPTCDDQFCIKRQKEYQVREAARPKEEKEELKEPEVVHEDNEWKIEVEDTEESSADNQEKEVAPGVKFEYTRDERATNENVVQVDDQVSIEKLMDQMKSL